MWGECGEYKGRGVWLRHVGQRVGGVNREPGVVLSNLAGLSFSGRGITLPPAF